MGTVLLAGDATRGEPTTAAAVGGAPLIEVGREGAAILAPELRIGLFSNEGFRELLWTFPAAEAGDGSGTGLDAGLLLPDVVTPPGVGRLGEL